MLKKEVIQASGVFFRSFRLFSVVEQSSPTVSLETTTPAENMSRTVHVR